MTSSAYSLMWAGLNGHFSVLQRVDPTIYRHLQTDRRDMRSLVSPEDQMSDNIQRLTYTGGNSSRAS